MTLDYPFQEESRESGLKAKDDGEEKADSPKEENGFTPRFVKASEQAAKPESPTKDRDESKVARNDTKAASAVASSKEKKESRKEKRTKEKRERKEKRSRNRAEWHCAYCNVTLPSSAEFQVSERL